MQAVCPSCRSSIALADVNVSTDLALCRQCQKTFSYAQLVSGAVDSQVDLNRAPPGAQFSRTARGFEVSASTRSPMALFLVPFMCVWSGGSLGGIYGTQLASGEFKLGPSLFGIPFVLGTLMFGSIAVMAVCGQVRVRVDGDLGSVFTGVGSLGWTRHFNWREMTSVSTADASSGRGRVTERITLQGQRRIDFAGNLNAERRHFMLAALRRMLLERR